MESTACVRGGCGGAGKPPQRGEDCMGKAMVAKRTREIRPSGMTWGVSGNGSDGAGETGTYRGNAETAEPLPKVGRAGFLSRLPYSRPSLHAFSQAVLSQGTFFRITVGDKPRFSAKCLLTCENVGRDGLRAISSRRCFTLVIS